MDSPALTNTSGIFFMIARKNLHFIVIALCLWLPLQAIAGQWLHCAQLDASLLQADDSSETTPHFSCHDAPVETQADYPASNPDKGNSADTQSCKHCQFFLYLALSISAARIYSAYLWDCHPLYTIYLPLPCTTSTSDAAAATAALQLNFYWSTLINFSV